MHFTEQELTTIKQAKLKIKRIRAIRITILSLMALSVVGLFLGIYPAQNIAYGLVALVFLSIALPQFGAKPTFEDLVALLENKTDTSPLP